MKFNKVILMAVTLVSVNAFSMEFTKNHATKGWHYLQAQSAAGYEKACAWGAQAKDFANAQTPVIAEGAKQGFGWAKENVQNAWSNKFVKAGTAVAAAAVVFAIVHKIVLTIKAHQAAAKAEKTN